MRGYLDIEYFCKFAEYKHLGAVVQSIVSANIIVKVNVNFDDNVNCCSKN